MTSLQVDGLAFRFPSNWCVSRYDEWSFYRNQFGKMRDGIKAVDLVAVDGSATAWLIEVKDYRAHARMKPTELSQEVHQKVFDTLAALLPACVNANNSAEQEMASRLLGTKKLRVVLHLEQPKKRSRLRPRAIDPVALTQQLRRLLKPIDVRPFVASRSTMGPLQWSVR